MMYAFAIGSALMGMASAQAVTATITPDASAPGGCKKSMDGKFEISVAQSPSKRAVAEKRGECGADGILVMTLEDGVLKDSQGRTGYIASNYQFQFDGPPQAGAIYTGGFSVCDGNVLALGDSKEFYRCLSGDFYNLYDRSWAEQCEPVEIVAMGCGGSTGELDDGQVVGTSMVQTTIVTALSDGQPQVVTTTMGIPMCQIGDGQVQVHTTPCVEAPPMTSSYVPITQSSEGQIEVPTSNLPPAPAPTTAYPTNEEPAPPAPTTGYPSNEEPAPPAPTSAYPSNEEPAPPAPTSGYPTSEAPVSPPPSSAPASSSTPVESSSSSIVTSASTTSEEPSEGGPTATAPPVDEGAAVRGSAPVGALAVGFLAAILAI